jgi:hypothetical protein
MMIRKRTQRMRGIQTHMPEFLAGDVILFAGQGDLYSKVGRWLMRSGGEGPTYAVHTAQFLDSQRVLEMDMVAKVKTVEDVLNKRYKLNLWRRRGFEVWRFKLLTEEQRRALTEQALFYANVRFGAAKFGAHMLDDLICKVAHRDIFLFRRLDPDDYHPVCSGITASVYDRAIHYWFGVEPACVDPDQIYDWVTSHPEEWVRVFCLAEYPEPGGIMDAAGKPLRGRGRSAGMVAPSRQKEEKTRET